MTEARVVFLSCALFSTAAELSSPGEFGLSDETPILQNPMCSGSEYYLCDCPGFALNNVVSDYCLSGRYQVGIRCIGGEQPKFNLLFGEANTKK